MYFQCKPLSESFLLLRTIWNVHMMIIIKEHLAVIRQDIDL